MPGFADVLPVELFFVGMKELVIDFIRSLQLPESENGQRAGIYKYWCRSVGCDLTFEDVQRLFE